MRPFSNTKGTATGLALTLALSLAAVPIGADAEVRFIVFGDAPYSPEQSDLLDETVAPAIKEDNASFLIHLGDMIGGGESCTNDRIGERYRQLMALYPGRVFYTPGDNEWTDCDRDWLDPRFSELERLDFLRTLIASTPMNLPAKWHYATQWNFPENARWTQGNVMFATIHMVSKNNGRENIEKDDEETTLDLVDARDRANLAWLWAVFDAAHNLGPDGAIADAVVIATQADMTELESENRAPCGVSERKTCDAFAAFRTELLRLAAAFPNPVLLVHGSTTPFCLDKKFGDDTPPNLSRLNAFGDNFDDPPVVDATVISVNLGDNDTDQPFEIKRLMTGDLLDRPCS